MNGFLLHQVLFAEALHNLIRAYLSLFLRNCLNDIGKLSVHALGQFKSKVGIHNKGNAALARLGINTHNRFILPADVRRVYGQIGHLPKFAAPLLHGLYAFVDSVLMGAGESREHQLASVRMSGMHRDLTAPLVNFNAFIHMLEGKFGINSLRKHIVGNI